MTSTTHFAGKLTRNHGAIHLLVDYG